MSSFAKTAVRKIWKILISLEFAVVVILLLTISLIVATILESVYDTPTAQYFVYRTWWFYGILMALGALIFCVAMSRLPWQKKHIPFLLAHLGILILLWGSWLTDVRGVDGLMTVQEGQNGAQVELSQPLLVVTDGETVKTVPVKWIPPEVKFKPISVPEYGLEIAEWITHADPKVDFVPATDSIDQRPALQVKVAGGPSAPPFMKMGQAAWVWEGDPSWATAQVGAAWISIASDREPPLPSQPGPAIGFQFHTRPLTSSAQAKLSYVVRTADGKLTKGTFHYGNSAELKGKVIQTGWKFDATVTLLDILPQAASNVGYIPSRIQYGTQANYPAIKLVATGSNGKQASVWLGQGDRATLESKGKKMTVGFFPRRVNLPFAVQLQRFRIDHYEGTENPSEFSSVVNVIPDADHRGPPPPKDHVISMNEPMKWGGYTFYQSSYIDAKPRPTVSVFSVNQDPGRWPKYIGSFLIILGSILLFASKYRTRKKPAAQAAQAS